MTNSRVLSFFTLLAVVWFGSLTQIVGQEYGARRALPQPRQGRPPGTDVSSLKKQAESGDAKAEYLLGRSYMVGAGVSQDYQEAARWYRLAAAQGSADAEFGLGFLYEHGKGVGQDYRQAVTYYTAAAKQGQATAENNLGSMYEHGQGVRRNLGEAARWYRLAADHGEVTAQCNLASLYFRGHGVAKDYAPGSNMVSGSGRARLRSGPGQSGVDVLPRSRRRPRLLR